MAVTITQYPDAYTPSDNPIVWVFSFPKTISGDDVFNLSFVCEIFVAGAGSIGKYEVLSQASDSSNFYGKIDVSNKVRSYIPVAEIKKTQVVNDASNYREVSVFITPKYSIVEQGTPTEDVANQTNTGVVNVFKACLSLSEFINWNSNDYKLGSLTMKLLTDIPFNESPFINSFTFNGRKGDDVYFQFIDDYTSNYNLSILMYNSSNTLYKTITINVSPFIITQVRINTALLVETMLCTQADVDNCTRLLVVINNATPTTISAIFSVYYNDDCFYRGRNILFLNKYGAYDSYVFTYNAMKSASISSKSYGANAGIWNNTSFGFQTSRTGNLSYQKTITDKIQIVSDWLTEQMQNWLVQIYESPAVYINTLNNYDSINITNSSYQLKQGEFDELINEVIDAEISITRNSITL